MSVESFEFRPLCFDLQPNFWNQFKEIKLQLSNWYSEIFQYIFCAYNCIHLELHLGIIFLEFKFLLSDISAFGPIAAIKEIYWYSSKNWK